MYKTSGFYNVIGGFDFKATNFLRPEIRVGYVLVNTDSQIISSSNIESIFEKSTTAIYIGILPKIILKGQNDNYYFQILPQYNFGKLIAEGNYVEIDENSNKIYSKNEMISKFKSFLGLGFGIHIFLSENFKESVDINLYFQKINFEDLISKLEYNKQSISTKIQLDLGLIFFLTNYKF